MRVAVALATLWLSLAAATPALAFPDVTACNGPLAPAAEGACQGVSSTGCCDVTGRAFWCEGADLYCIDCTDGFDHCGWNPLGYYDCGQSAGASDPSGLHPLSCLSCNAECGPGSACTPDCPGTCGSCGGPDEVCLEDGTCWVPDCAGKQCGHDSLGFSCGSCPSGTECVEGLWQCQSLPEPCVASASPGCDGCGCESCVCDTWPTCCTEGWDVFCAQACELECGFSCSPCPEQPTCDGIECGAFCGVDCGSCAEGSLCLDFACCTPDCDGKVCGSDGCGGTCGSCEGNDDCVGGECVPCQPKCAGKECGDDSCGGTCGGCAVGEVCAVGQCTNSYCDGQCTSGAIDCGPDCECFCDNDCFYFGNCCPGICDVCAPEFPNDCCQTQCEGKTCGDDGCGGSCGGCPPGQICDEAFSFCIQCAPACDGKTCGDDGCGASCGDCSVGNECDPSGQCVTCQPKCDGKTCGDDGCGGVCGNCAGGAVCSEGECTPEYCAGRCGKDSVPAGAGVTCGCDAFCFALGTCCPGVCTSCTEELGVLCCEPQCGGKECGDDGCLGSCGVCKGDQSCISGICVACQPDCLNKGCGDDGCGGSCGQCTPGHLCEAGVCIDCDPQCDGKSCGDDGCGGSCGPCTGDCIDGVCDGCVPDCAGKACGTNGCGGSCGQCPDGHVCSAESVCEVDPGDCEPQCDGKECGDDGCGSFCGSCPDGKLCQSGLCAFAGRVTPDAGPETGGGFVTLDTEGPVVEEPAPPKSSGCAGSGPGQPGWPLAFTLALTVCAAARRR